MLERSIFEVGSRNVLSNSDLHTKTKVSALQDDIFEGKYTLLEQTVQLKKPFYFKISLNL